MSTQEVITTVLCIFTIFALGIIREARQRRNILRRSSCSTRF